MSQILEREAENAQTEEVAGSIDVEIEFDRLWLDESMTQSSARWQPGDTLELAQDRNRDWHIAAAGVSAGSRVLELGCGWGTLLQRMVEAYGVEEAVGLTLSRRQAEHIVSAGHPKLRALEESWELHEPESPYDAAISIGAFERFLRPGLSSAEKVAHFRSFFARCRDWLKAGGKLSLQTICFAPGYGAEFAPFFDSVFPNSDLPTFEEIRRAADGLFEIEIRSDEPADYSRTLLEWRDRLLSRKDEALALVGELTIESHERYMTNAARLFDSGLLTLLRLGLRRVD